ncbi:hypothetical protein LY39_00771 [Roseinatronobacter bogoriensis subsp. barguzinensis]|nr:hypothetical protein [Rhodobaca bogoriensis DSM 18756]TDW41663.1 hypothetical protein LY39_00771 [Rhodobaca barguzinensis]TDY74158.1 hypothetical protein EV660_101193 [Rhodobaca bogoriensis DSM 18756]
MSWACIMANGEMGLATRAAPCRIVSYRPVPSCTDRLGKAQKHGAIRQYGTCAITAGI